MTHNIAATLAALRDQFQGRLLDRVAAIREAFGRLDPAAWQPDEAELLHRLVHGLTGTAGTFGLVAVSAVAGKLESVLSAVLASHRAPDGAGWQSVACALDDLEQSVGVCLSSNAPTLSPQHVPAARTEHAPLIHLVEDDPEQAGVLLQCLQEHGFRVRHFATLGDFSAVIRAKAGAAPAAVVMDMMFPEGAAAGAVTVAALGLGPDAGIPVVFVSVRDDLAARLAAYRAGASRYLTKPVDAIQLSRLLDDLTGRMPPEPFRVLLVDDDRDLLDFHAAVLGHAGMNVLTVTQPLETLAALERFVPDVVVLDVYMQDASGPELAAVIREQDRHMNLPILFLSTEGDMSKQLMALNLGGDDFLVKPVEPGHLVAAVTARARRSRQNTETMQRLRSTLYEREREHLALDQHALVSIADANGLITYANEAFCKVSGYSLEELHGNAHNLLKSGPHVPDVLNRDRWATLKSGNIWRGELCNQAKDGSLYWVNATIAPYLDGAGKVYQYVSIHSDISALKESQETLRTAKERLRRGQLFANIGTWDWNIQTGELYWSERIAPLFGYPEGELETSYENFINALHPDDRPAVIGAINACVERDVPYEIEHRVVWPDGTVRWLLERGAKVRNGDGKSVQMLGVVQDIDDRKRAELALAERERQLREAQTLARIGNWTADMISGELTWSDEIYRIFGHEPGSFAPSLAAFQAAVHPDDRALVRESELRAEQTGHHGVVHRILRPDGTVRHVQELAQADTNAAGKLLKLTGTVQDITERVVAEQALLAARDEADRANRAKSDFLSSMSHELRTPMNAILGFAQMLESDSALGAAQKGDVHEILKAGRHLLDLINEVLDLAKIESGRIDLALEAIELAPLGEDCRQLIQPLAAQRGIALHLELPAAATVFADRVRLRQVLLNLLANAIKYNRAAGAVHLGARANGSGRLRIDVRDTGPGIPAGRLKDLFQPFNRLDAEQSEVEGTGIGLTITRRMVEMMGGEIGVDSEVGVGSTFWLDLPVSSTAKVGDGGMAAVYTDYLNKPLDVERCTQTIDRCLRGDQGDSAS